MRVEINITDPMFAAQTLAQLATTPKGHVITYDNKKYTVYRMDNVSVKLTIEGDISVEEVK